MKKHIPTHTFGKAHRCFEDPECDFSCNDPSSLLRHRKNIHGIVIKRRTPDPSPPDPSPPPPPSKDLFVYDARSAPLPSTPNNTFFANLRPPVIQLVWPGDPPAVTGSSSSYPIPIPVPEPRFPAIPAPSGFLPTTLDPAPSPSSSSWDAHMMRGIADAPGNYTQEHAVTASPPSQTSSALTPLLSGLNLFGLPDPDPDKGGVQVEAECTHAELATITAICQADSSSNMPAPAAPQTSDLPTPSFSDLDLLSLPDSGSIETNTRSPPAQIAAAIDFCGEDLMSEP